MRAIRHILLSVIVLIAATWAVTDWRCVSWRSSSYWLFVGGGGAAFISDPEAIKYYEVFGLPSGWAVGSYQTFGFLGEISNAWFPHLVTLTFRSMLLVTIPPWLVLHWIARKQRRAKLGICLHCGYNLTGNESGRCSECGTPAHAKRWRAIAGAAADDAIRAVRLILLAIILATIVLWMLSFVGYVKWATRYFLAWFGKGALTIWLGGASSRGGIWGWSLHQHSTGAARFDLPLPEWHDRYVVVPLWLILAISVPLWYGVHRGIRWQRRRRLMRIKPDSQETPVNLAAQ